MTLFIGGSKDKDTAERGREKEREREGRGTNELREEEIDCGNETRS